MSFGRSDSRPEAYRSVLHRARHELSTPALILDLPTFEQNISAMAEWAHGRVALRPHVKVHKSVDIARRQMAAGAIGVTAATVWEAAAMVGGGIESVLLANEVVDVEKADLLASAACSARVAVAVDDPANARVLSQSAHRAEATFDVLIDVDIGMTRGGVRSVPEALRLAETLSGLPGMRLSGVMGWEGHAAGIRDRSRRAAEAVAATATLLTVADALRDAGFDVSTVSAGGTNTYDITGSNAAVTDIQPGTYAVMDTAYAELAPAFKPALTILGTVVSRHDGRAVLDCGTKVQAVSNLAAPRLAGDIEGAVLALHEEHALVEVRDPAALHIGEKIELFVSYAAGTINLNDAYYVCDADRVVDVWPIRARGSGQGPRPGAS